MSKILFVVADRQIMGEIQRDQHGHLTFAYDDHWRSMDGAYPLSLSMPLSVDRYENSKIEPWLRGLLPDNPYILDSWGKRFHVSPRNAFALLAEIGEDCAGAVQLTRPDRLDDILKGSDDDLHVYWLTESDIAGRLRALQENPAAWRSARDTGQFSLAGAQPKTALYFNGQYWGVPSSPTPTTHILKPSIAELDGHVENEHLCLELARALGLPAARSEVHRYEDQVALFVERYDRTWQTFSSIRRLHQEDLCQVMGLSPTHKYPNEGGLGCAKVIETIWTHSKEPRKDTWTFACTTMLNWIIARMDAHARNFSMLIGPRRQVQLAPLYNFASALPYDFDPEKLKMAIKIGGEYWLKDISALHWGRLAAELSLPPEKVLNMGKTLAGKLPKVFSEIVDRARADGLNHPIMTRMVDLLGERSRQCANILEAAG